MTAATSPTRSPSHATTRAVRGATPTASPKRPTFPLATPTPATPVSVAKSVAKRAVLRVWVSGQPQGINHSQIGMGKHRHKTDKAKSWGDAVWSVVYDAAHAQTLYGAARWGVLLPDPLGKGAQLRVDLHFFVSGGVNHLDVDAPLKATLDEVMRALRLDDTCVRQVTVAQSLVEEAPLKRATGYGATTQGCWIAVRRLTPTERRALDALTPPTLPTPSSH